MSDFSCIYCQSGNVRKYGTYKETQYYYWDDCKRKFSHPDAIPKMQYSTDKVANAISMYYEGMSLKEIRRDFIRQYNDYISDVTVLNWINLGAWQYLIAFMNWIYMVFMQNLLWL
jgi:transposase-like protein